MATGSLHTWPRGAEYDALADAPLAEVEIHRLADVAEVEDLVQRRRGFSHGEKAVGMGGLRRE